MNHLFSSLTRSFVGTLSRSRARRRSLGGLALVFSCAAIAWVGLAPGAQAKSEGNYRFTLEGRVVQVTDGDTFNMLVNGRTRRVRMASIDAPEVGKGREQPGQPFSQASRQALAALIAGKTVVARCYEEDRYGRSICDVPLSETETANQRMVAQGLAWANMEKRGQFLRDPRMPDLQRAARSQGLGIWSETDPVEPWRWRYQCWRQKQCAGQGD